MTDSGQVVLQLPIDHLQPNPLQPRGAITTDSLTDLVDSIQKHGILEPLVVAETPAGYQIIAGERRWRASKLAGLETVPVLVKKTTPRGMLEMAIVENVQRSDLNAIDRAKAFERLMMEFNLTTRDIADRVSKSSPYVSNSLRLLKLPDALKDGLLSGQISEGHARALAAIDDPRLMVEAYKQVLHEDASVRRAEELARRVKHQQGKEVEPVHKEIKVYVTEEIDRMQESMQKPFEKIGALKLKRSRRETKIQIVLKGNPEKTQQALEKLEQSLSNLNFEETSSPENQE